MPPSVSGVLKNRPLPYKVQYKSSKNCSSNSSTPPKILRSRNHSRSLPKFKKSQSQSKSSKMYELAFTVHVLQNLWSRSHIQVLPKFGKSQSQSKVLQKIQNWNCSPSPSKKCRISIAVPSPPKNAKVQNKNVILLFSRPIGISESFLDLVRLCRGVELLIVFFASAREVFLFPGIQPIFDNSPRT